MNTGIRVLKTGWVFALIMTLLLVAAWNTGTNLLYIVLGGVVSFVALSVVLSWWTLRRLSVKCEAPQAVHRGDPFLLELRIENHKRIMPSVSLRVESDARPEESAGFVVRVPAQRAAILHISETFEHRGVHLLPPITLVSGFPFGLLEWRRRFPSEETITVFPKVRAIRSSTVEQMPGGRRMARASTADGEEFFGLREYMPGDELRHIAWRVSARMGKWMVRELAREDSRHVYFILDSRCVATQDDLGSLEEAGRIEEHFEEAVELVASLAVVLLYRQYGVGLVTPDGAVEEGHGSGQERKLLEHLARVQLADARSHAGFEVAMHALESEPAKLVYVTPDDTLWGGRGAGELRVLDPREVTYA